jgi:hypothetical protein
MPQPALKPLKELPPSVAIERFIEEATSDYGADDHIELSSHVYAVYRHWSKVKRLAPMTRQACGRELAKRYDRARAGNGRQRAWEGIRLDSYWSRVIEAPRKPISSTGLVRRFLSMAAERDAVAVEPSAHIFQAFRKWCEWTQYPPLDPFSFGRELTKLRIETERYGHGGMRARRGIRLSPDYKAAAVKALEPGELDR